MATRGDKRTRLVKAADKLVQRQGYHATSLADIAAAAGVPLGNVYYYFRSKEALGDALIGQRGEHYRARRATWDREPDPKTRLRAFVEMTVENSTLLARSGCPIGSLCQELHKQGGPLAEAASGMFAEFLDWLEMQFRALGKGAESRELAVHVMSALQGATLLTHSFRSPRYIESEARRLKAWIEAL
ncbi:TetR family transcriptional regulator [Sulfurifustis variabilis]|uniref:TetR family transcriptional regulator n=1 Tax=Sulfurifustis variabilis TaxID=1675686 RepID=A0A1B4V0E7_9GAMM|nr:TetR/AcrR family transcriptional regulator [Sulfurifustis variabilis]BAU46655.1 TetR family transcriptional regulator [Sulfurifustis variabilis]